MVIDEEFNCDISIQHIEGTHTYEVSLACDEPRHYDECIVDSVDKAIKWLTPRLLQLSMQCLVKDVKMDGVPIPKDRRI